MSSTKGLHVACAKSEGFMREHFSVKPAAAFLIASVFAVLELLEYKQNWMSFLVSQAIVGGN